MNVAILYNPISGAGRAADAARDLARTLRACGHEVDLTETRPDPFEGWLERRLRGADLLVVAGGDGAMRLASEPARLTGTAVYHYPCGTENLFARQWGMAPRPEALRRAIEHGRVETVDVGRANGRPFLLMASVGYDAEVVADLCGVRRGAIRHRHYAAPMLRQLRRWRPPRLVLTVDGRRLETDEPGMVVVANSRQYGWRLDPASRADMSDGRLDAVFFPVRSRRQLLGWMVRARLRRHLGCPGVVYETGAEVIVEAGGPFRYQVDGDRPDGPDVAERLTLGVVPRCLRVLAGEKLRRDRRTLR